MYLTPVQALVMILAVALATAITRFLPFLLFPESKQPPKLIEDLSRLLPPAMMGLLVIYCLKGVDLTSAAQWLPQLLGVAVTAAVHLWRRNTLLSIAVGTALYMILVQFVFV